MLKGLLSGGSAILLSIGRSQTARGAWCGGEFGEYCILKESCCNGFCVEIGTNRNCRHCGDECESHLVCKYDGCGCAGYKVDCGGVCVDIDTSENCGACGNACHSSQECNSLLEPNACICVGFGPVDIRTDPKHCGACRNACPDGVDCVNGRCQGAVDTQPASGESQPGISGSTYTSPTWEFSLAWDSRLWTPDARYGATNRDDPDGTRHNDCLGLTNEHSVLIFCGYEDVTQRPGDPQACVEWNASEFAKNSPGVTNFALAENDRGQEMKGTGPNGSAFAVHTFDLSQSNAQPMAALHMCHTLVDQYAVLVILFATPLSEYPNEIAKASAVIETLSYPNMDQNASNAPAQESTCAGAGETCIVESECCGDLKCKVSPLGGRYCAYCKSAFEDCEWSTECCSSRCVMGGCAH